MPLLFWLPAVAATLHVVEEFVWPGGFRAWYARYRPETGVSATPRLLVAVNALLLALTIVAATLGDTPRGAAYWLTAASIMGANAWFHLHAAWRMRSYSPGMVTGALLYAPLALVGFPWFVGTGRAALGSAAFAALIGPAYHVYSAHNHRRRAARMHG